MRPTNKPILLVTNPRSGRGKSVQVATKTQAVLIEHGLATEVMSIEALEATSSPPKVKSVAVFGGDGTIRGVVRHYLSRPPFKLPDIMPIPVGTANLLGKHLSLKSSKSKLPHLVLKTLRRPRVREVDIATLNQIPFLIMCSCGIDAEIVHKVSSRRTGPISKLSYIKPLVESLRDFAPPELTVRVDGHVIFGPAKGFAMVANMREYGAGFSIVPEATPDDGLLDVRIFTLPSRRRLLSTFAKSAIGVFESPCVRGRVVTIDSDHHVPLQVDGDPAGHTPARVEISPQKLRLLMPTG